MRVFSWLRIVAVALAIAVQTASICLAQSSSRTDPVLEAVRTSLLERLNTSSSPVRATVIDASTLKAEGPDNAELTISLDNLVADIRTKPEQRAALVDRFARMVELTIGRSSNPTRTEMSKSQFSASLRPVIRHKDYLTATTGTAVKGSEFEILWRPLVGDAPFWSPSTTPNTSRW